jgi:hypothetical protein
MKAPTHHTASPLIVQINAHYRSLLLLLLIVLTPLALSSPVEGARGFPLDSVQSLDDNGSTFCTVFSINEQEGNWGTAAHCALYVDELLKKDHQVTISGQPAHIAYIDAFNDLAVLQSKARARTIPLSRYAPAVGDQISIIGYPLGITRTVTQGYIAARLVPILHPFGFIMTSDFLDITTIGGNSGSPVLNSRHEVIGLLWGGFSDAPLALSITWEAICRSLGGYWEAR